MTVRNHMHSRATARISQLLGVWLDAQPSPRGDIVDGEAGFRLPGESADIVGLDVAYIDADLATQSAEVALLEGLPILAVEFWKECLWFLNRHSQTVARGVRIVQMA